MAAPTKRRAAAPSAQRDMEKELAAAGTLKHQLSEIFGDDHDLALLRDTLEGETDLLETLDRVLEQMAVDAANIAGIEKFATTLAARKKRLEDRYSTMETMLLNALTILEERRLERPLALIFTKAKPAKAVITDEAMIPSQFFKTPEPQLSKADLLRALKDHRDTLAQKLAEIAERVEAQAMSEQEAEAARARAVAAFPAIPGAELDAEGTSIQVKWS
ncbi:siphovirus Gp157 family protein [Bradyrhizobium sp. SZCCHNR2035]|uniref:siphovirus Gp157 family protein n=1 Tax=Bradyrhizobium sp. SZCCHNR2035 TaxID=3057386 RepID=UPI002915E3CC|nr:siphovirus Gp157 family protein [Bradyrhizobium sp. SZCCHNR2035]